MTASLTREAESYFYLNLSTYNDTNAEKKATCELHLKEALISNLSEYEVAVLRWSASLGSNSLYFQDANPDMWIVYKQIDLKSGHTMFTERRSLNERSYSIGDVIRQLNPSSHSYAKEHKDSITTQLSAGFEVLSDGRLVMKNYQHVDETNDTCVQIKQPLYCTHVHVCALGSTLPNR